MSVITCPVCDTEYNEKRINCEICQWNLTPFSLAIRISPLLLEREKEKIEWAKKCWVDRQFISKNKTNYNQDHDGDYLKNKLVLVDLENQIEDFQSQFDKQRMELEIKQQEVNALKEQLLYSNAQLNTLVKLERMAKAALSQWIEAELLNSFILDVKSITDHISAIKKVKLVQQEYNRDDFSVHRILIQYILDFLSKQHEKIPDDLLSKLDPYNTILVADAIIEIQSELKIRGVLGSLL